jgi:hypothetical protein
MAKKLLQIDSSEKNNFLIPITLYLISFLLDFWGGAILVYVVSLSLLKKEYLLVFFAAASFFNIMLLSEPPSILSLITTFGGLSIIVYRIYYFNMKKWREILFLLGCMLFIFISFSFSSSGEYYFRTGIKSSLQLVFSMTLITVLLSIDEDLIVKTKSNLVRHFDKFLVPYLLFGLFLNGDRYGGFVGPQAISWMLVTYLLFRKGSLNIKLTLFYFVFLVLSGSRTYLFLVFAIYIVDYFISIPYKHKLRALLIVPMVLLIFILVMPFMGERFDFTSDEFLGSFFGRFHNYIEAWEFIKLKPIFGWGMGSMIKTLETWVFKEGFEIYKVTGDTTIMHNEYLRILMEMGIVGLGLFLVILNNTWKTLKRLKYRYVLIVFMISCLLENNLTLFSTGTLFLILVVAFSRVGEDTKSYLLKVDSAI